MTLTQLRRRRGVRSLHSVLAALLFAFGVFVTSVGHRHAGDNFGDFCAPAEVTAPSSPATAKGASPIASARLQLQRLASCPLCDWLATPILPAADAVTPDGGVPVLRPVLTPEFRLRSTHAAAPEDAASRAPPVHLA